VRGLAVAPDVQTRGVGRALVAACEAEARRIGIPTLFAWTYSVAFFEKCGFTLIDKTRELHPRVWSECLRCPFFVGCNENGLIKRLDGVPMPRTCPSRRPRRCRPASGSCTPVVHHLVYDACMDRHRTNIELDAAAHLAGQPLSAREALALRGARLIAELPADAPPPA
jgi:hypothetical protein